MKYYLGPYVWTEEPGLSFWSPPNGTVSSVDLRSEAGGCGFFAVDNDVTLGSDYTLLGRGNPRDITLSERDKKVWASRVGIKENIESTHLLGLLWDTLGVYSDPTGQDRPRPIMPCRDGCMELHLSGKQKSRPLGRDRREWPAIRDALRRQLRQAKTDAEAGRLINPVRGVDALFHRRLLKSMCEKLRGFDWREVVPSGWELLSPLEHNTTISDNFNRADGALGSSSEGWSWTVKKGDLQISGNAAKPFALDSDARADANLSSDDHYSQAAITLGASAPAPAVLARVLSTSDRTHYYWRLRSDWEMRKYISGSLTSLGSYASGSAGTIRLTADGSTITGWANGSDRVSVTDTSITGNLRCGIGANHADDALDNFEAADLGGGGGITYTQLERDTRGQLRGVYRA